jgi:hypothetical protein
LPLPFWKDNKHLFPAIASIAQDILSIPASGAGVERLCNTARDICHYRRGGLNSTTIQELMMFLCTLRFDIQEEGLTFLKEYFSLGEIEAAKEEREDTSNQFELDPISDNEEDGRQEEDDHTQDPILSGDEIFDPNPTHLRVGFGSGYGLCGLWRGLTVSDLCPQTLRRFLGFGALIGTVLVPRIAHI